MRQERAEGCGGDLLVPMAWMHAEFIADDLLRGGDLMPPTTLEYRAGRGALALTIFLSDGSVDGPCAVARMAEWRSLTRHGSVWREWVCDRLDRMAARAFEAGGTGRGKGDRLSNGTDDGSGGGSVGGGGTPDLDLASATWRWLEETELLAPDLNAVVPPGNGRAPRREQEGPQVWTPAWELGLPLGHLSMHLY
jgi:hypothetical protein